MILIFRAFFWLAALLGVWSATQALLSYRGVPEVKDAVLFRDDPLKIEFKHVLCAPPPGTRVTITDAAILSALAYPTPQPDLRSHLQATWEQLPFDAAQRAALLPADWNNKLYFEIWKNTSSRAVVIAFRGTENATDWYANLHWFTKFLGFRTQYQDVNLAIPKLVDVLHQTVGSDVQIVSTGHSLGGGLAQHALYSSDGITRAIVFNATPVTGWHELDLAPHDRAVAGNRVFRIHESHEVLEIFRYLMRFEYSINPLPNESPKFWEYRFNFKERGSQRTSHGIVPLATHLVEQAQKSCNF